MNSDFFVAIALIAIQVGCYFGGVTIDYWVSAASWFCAGMLVAMGYLKWTALRAHERAEKALAVADEALALADYVAAHAAHAERLEAMKKPKGADA